ncbi:MAG: hypothetical protein ACTSQE_05230 [Candidatus Heimdallarchaeaceae archaeon]
MSEREQCGDYEIFQDEEDGWWTVRNIKTGVILGKFMKKADALEKIAVFFREEGEEEDEEDEYLETGSVC